MTRKTIHRKASTDTFTGQGIGGSSDGPPVIEQDDLVLKFTCFQQDRNSRLDLSQTGEVVEFRLEDASGTNQVTKDSSGSDVSLVSASNGLVEVVLSGGSSGDTALAVESHTYELTLTDDGSSQQTVLAQGEFQVDGRVA